MDKAIIRGAGKGGSSGGGHESDDTLFSTAYVEIVELYGEGTVKGLVNGGQSLYLDGTPIIAADGKRNHKVSYQIRPGTQNQSPFPQLQSTSAETNVGTQVLKATPITRTITAEEADFAVVTLGFPRMMHIDDKGNIDGTEVEYKIECQPDGGSYQLVSRSTAIGRGTYDAINNYWQSPDKTYSAEIHINNSTGDDVILEYSADGVTFTLLETIKVSHDNHFRNIALYNASTTVDWPEGVHYLRFSGSGYVIWTSYGAAGTVKVNGKCGTRYQRQHRFELPGSAPWQVRVTRITNDSGSAKLSNDLYWDSLRTEIVARLNYPLSALAYWRIPAKEFSSIPRRQIEWFGGLIRIPNNYNPITRVYTGVWDGGFTTAWTDNPAWWFYDLATSKRYGVGKYVKTTGIDKWALYKIAQYCDGLVDSGSRNDSGDVIYEPRFTINAQIVQPREAFQWLNDIVSIFRGMMYVINGLLTCIADQPADPVRLFNQTNVIDGQFKFTGTAALARKTVALVHWKDPSDLYSDKVEYVPDRNGIKRYGITTTEVTAVGCTSRGQAHRLGKWLLIDGEIVQFAVGHDASFVAPGEIINCAIPLRSNNKRLGGRLKSLSGTAVVLDAPVTLISGHDYQLSVVLTDGSVGSRDIVENGITTDSLTLASAFSGDVIDQALWVLIDWDGIQPTQWRVLNIADSDGFTKTITAISHNPDKYTAIDTFNAPIDSSLLPTVNPLNIAAPSTVTIENLPFTDKNGVSQNKLHVSWSQVAKAVRYDVRWRRDNGNWHNVPSMLGPLYELIIKDDGIYEFEVAAINVLGKQSPPTSESVGITGDGTEINFESQWDEM